MKTPPILNYQRSVATPRAVAVFLPLPWISLALGSISVIGFLAVAGWQAMCSAIMSIVALVLGVVSHVAVSSDRAVRSCSIWIAAVGSIIFGFIALVHLLIVPINC
jgi:LytS/YehU family sensor histidine kinase